MIVLKNVIYVCSEDGLPIRAHLLRLIDIGVLPSRAIIWKNEETASSRDFISKIKIAFPYFLKIYRVIKSIYKAESKGDVDYSINIFGKNIFSLSNKPEKILKRSNIPFKVICSKSINDKRLIDEINNTNGYYVVVAKAGGILKESILSINKKFINIHKGIFLISREAVQLIGLYFAEGNMVPRHILSIKV